MTVATSSTVDRRAVAHAFAEVLSYPYVAPATAARECAEVAAVGSRDAGALLDAFAALVETTSLGTLQEAYTRTFDLDTMSRSEPTCYPYVGHYLFDESHKRGAFILGLKRRFRKAGFADESDLPDHLIVLLRFLAVCDDEQLADELVDDAILPALERMDLLTKTSRDGSAPARDAYLGVLAALRLALAVGRPERIDDEADETQREWARDRDSLGIERDRC